MYTPAQFFQIRREMRKLRIDNANLNRWHLSQKQRADRLEGELREKIKQVNRLEKEKQRLEHELEKTRQERDTYKNMTFKGNRKSSPSTGIQTQFSGRHRGGQKGHKGYSRKKPIKIDKQVDVFLTHCLHCNSSIPQTDSVDTHTVTDLPHWQMMLPITTEYSIQRQWCPKCGKEVKAVPQEVIPGSRLGANLITMVMVWRYRFREPLNKIAERLFTHYGIHISQGALVKILGRSKDWLGPNYEKILEEIRGSPVKHADETGWRVNGENWWCWGGITTKSVYYTIEDSRGGGVARDIFKNATGVLVRDDYPGYSKLPLVQQSCWSHPVRISRDLAEREDASDEIKFLHKNLQTLFALLEEDIKQPFVLSQRQELFSWYKEDLRKIIDAKYRHIDAQKLQTRIRNQNTNLLTALLHEGVPLTNNPAEQALRAVVVTRKISGGSRSPDGAKTHAVNLSVIETIVKRKLPLLDTLQEYLLKGAAGKN